METLQCADPKSLMPSTFSLNMTNYKVANVEASSCILKSDTDSSNNSRPVSIILARTPSGSGNYVHVLRCSSCDFSTLLLSTLKDHIKSHHPANESIVLLSCPQCGSSSTERNLLDEHMKLYHFNFEASSYKFLETRHMIYKSEPTPAAAMTIPFTISSPAATVGSLRVGLTSPPPPQPPPSSFTPQPTASISVVPSQSSPPSHSIPSTNSDTNQLSIETEPVYSNPDKANAVQGSRRRKATTPGKLRALALTVNGDAEDLVEQMCKKRKLEPPMVNGEVQQAATHIRPHSAMVCNVNDLVEVLKCQHAQQQQQQQHAANAMGEVDEVSNTTPKVTTAIMMDANSAKNLVTQLLAAAAAGQGRIELGGTAPLPLSGEQALDMSVRPAVDPQQPLQTQVKTAELKLADLIQADQLQSSTTSGLDSLRSALMAQLTGAVFPPPAGVQQITIGLPSAQPQSTPSFDITKAEANPVKQVSTSQLVNFSQLQALISALANVKSSNPPKDPLHEAISSQMLLHPASSLITSTTSTATPLVAAAVDGLNSGAISFSSAGLALASALAPPTTANSLKGISLPTGEFIPVANLMPGQPTGLGSFTFTNCTPPNSLANFVTSLGGAPVPTSASTPIHRFSAETSSTIQQRAAQPTQPHPAQLPFEAALFATAAAAAAGNPLNIVAQPALQFRTPASTQAQSINGSVAPVTVVSSVSRNETSPLLISQPLREVTSCASLEEVGGGTDTDTSLTTGLEGEEVGEEVTLGSHPEIDESGSPLSTTGIRKLSKSNRRSSSGLGTRPHRQNFTALQNRILTDWYNSHHYKPYPSTEDTKMLAQKSELTYSQVKKWFANKRARTSNNGLPKPMPPTAPDTPSTTASDTSAFVAAAVAAAAAANQPTVLSNGNSVVQSPASSIIVPSGLMIRPAGATLAATLGNSGLTILAPRPPPPPPPPPQPTQTLPATSGTEFHTSEEASAHHSPEVSKEDNSDPPALTSSPSSPTNEKQSTGNVSASSPTSSSPVIKEETN
uniref:C2H2-type domain-containing protein n=1 Tax=Mesocestoides corti TaxID=53468 RepID=A0A5K3FBK1_MESCO